LFLSTLGCVDNTGFEKFRSQTKFMDARWGRVLSCLNSDPDLLVILYALPDDNPASAKTKFASLIYYFVVSKGYQSNL
jgi:hypothetical protein